MSPPPVCWTGWRRRLRGMGGQPIPGRGHAFTSEPWEAFVGARTKTAVFVVLGELELRADHSNWEYAVMPEGEVPRQDKTFGEWRESRW